MNEMCLFTLDTKIPSSVLLCNALITLDTNIHSSLASTVALQSYGPVIVPMGKGRFAPLHSRNYLTLPYQSIPFFFIDNVDEIKRIEKFGRDWCHGGVSPYG